MIQAIETEYNGYRFRSRLEARWAVYFDVLGFKYRYEPEGFDLNGTWYLPDFWVEHYVEELAAKGWGWWVEIKPFQATPEEASKFFSVVEATRHNGTIIQGEPFWGKFSTLTYFGCHQFAPWPQPRVDDRRAFLPQIEPVFPDDPSYSPWPFGQAFAAARGARFEHGEVPA